MPTIDELRSRSDALFTGLMRAQVGPTTARARRAVAARPVAPTAGFSWFKPEDAMAATTLAFRLGAYAASRADELDGLEAALDHATDQGQTSAPELARQGLAIFVIHSRSGRRLSQPRPVAVAPGLFVPSPRRRNRHAISIGGAAPELDYWREDALANEHHQHWHDVYPYRGLPPADIRSWLDTTPTSTQIAILTALDPTQDWSQLVPGAAREQIASLFSQVVQSGAVAELSPELYRTMFRLNDRQGELFFYMHEQMLARYDAELLSHRLDRVEAFGPDQWNHPIPEGHRPTGLVGFKQRDPDRQLPSAEIATLRRLAGEITEALDNRQLRGPSGSTVEIDRTRLGEVVEAAAPQLRDVDLASYPGLHGQGHVAVAELSSGGDGVMASTLTAIRDQIFWRWHKYIDDLSARWQDEQSPYDFADAPSVVVRNDLVATDAPAWSSPDIILCRATDLPPGVDPSVVGEQLFGGTNWDVDFTERDAAAAGHQLSTIRELRTSMSRRTVDAMKVDYLSHTPFSYFLRVENLAASEQRITIRLFLAPAEIADDRRAWIEMDKFVVELAASARTVIHRRDVESSVVKRPAEPDPSNVRPGGGDPDETAYCDCGWPYTLLLPRGTSEGMEFRLMVICTDAAIDHVAMPGDCGSMSYCGAVDRYPDFRDMGYPFNRRFGDGVSALADRLVALSSAAARTVVIRHGSSESG
jgi:hypothetical protein